MDERAIKRLVITLVVSIAMIMALKTMLMKTAIKVNSVVTEKRQLASPKPNEAQLANAPPPAAIIETAAASPVAETASLEATSASGVPGSP